MTPTKMTCTLDSKAFANAAALAARRVMATPQMPILGGLLLELDDEGPAILRVTGFDGDSSTTAVVDAGPESVPAAGRVVVSGSKLAQLVKTLPAKPITLTELDSALRMTCGSVAIELPLMPVEDFPKLPTGGEPAGTVDALDLRGAIERVISACDLKGETSRPPLTGVHVKLTRDELTLTASNGYRVALAAAPWNGVEGGLHDKAVLVPGRILADVASSLTGLGQVRIGLNYVGAAGDDANGPSTTVVSFDGLGATTVSRLLEAKLFPGRPKAQYIARGDTPTEVPTVEVLQALKWADMVNDPKVRHVVLRFDGDTVVVSATGGVCDTATWCKHPGAPAVVTVNSGYLADALVACDSAVAELTFGETPMLPLRVTSPGVEGFAHIIMPIRKR